MNIPLIAEFKQEFVFRRIIQTFFGGVKLVLGYKAPVYVYILQILLLFTPCILGVLFVLLTETKYLVFPQHMYGFGILMFFFVIGVQMVSRSTTRRVSSFSEIKKKSASLTDGEQLDFSTCLSTEIIQFIVPPKKYFINIIFHGLVSAVMCGLCIHFLLPSVVGSSLQNLAAMWFVIICGWFSLCVAQFPLTTVGAPEPAVYQPLDMYEITAVSRALYVIAILSIFGIQVGEYEIQDSHGIYIHIIIAILPILWCTNILPPADVLLCWASEQFLIHFLGSSPQMSNFRLFIMLGLSSITLLAVHYIPYIVVTKIILVLVASVLSANIGFIFDLIRHKISNHMLQKVSLQPPVNPEPKNKIYFILIGHVAITIICIVASITKEIIAWDKNTDTTISNITTVALAVIWAMSYLFSDLQSVCVFFGAIRNPLYPSTYLNLTEFRKRKSKLQWIGVARFLLLKFGLLVAIVNLSTANHHPDSDCMPWSCWLFIACLVRAYRSVWQSLENSILDLVIVNSLYYFQVPLINNHKYFVTLLLVSFIRHRSIEVLQKLYVVTIIAVAFVTLRKQRLWYSWCLMSLDIIFSPLILAIVVLSSVISAPLLPLFTLPIFLFSFPRPVKFWPNSASEKSSSKSVCSDAVYYKQLAPRLAVCMSKAIRYGSLGNVQAGDKYLLRFDDRMVWIQALEHGHNFVTIVMKGLELQETSCHTREAAELDEMFEDVFNFTNKKKRIHSRCYNSLTPIDTVMVNSYSDSRTVLTGVIDNPTFLAHVPELFPKVLSIVLFIHSINCALEQTSEIQDGGQEENESRKSSVDSVNKLTMFDPTHDRNSQTVNVDVEEKWAEHVADMAWSDEEDPLGGEVKRNSATYLTSLSSMPDHTSLPGYAGGLEQTDQIVMYEWAPPISDSSKSNDSPELKETLLFEDPPDGRSDQCRFSRIGFKSLWLNTPREKNSKWPRLSGSWMHETLKMVLDSYKSDLSKHFSDTCILPIYQNVVTCCTRAFFGENGNALNPANVYRTFLGDLQWSLTAEWLRQNDDLMVLAFQAYRYCIKLSLDKILFAENEEDSIAEFYKQTKLLIDDWYIGPDKTKAWDAAVQKETPSLFSLGHSDFHNNFTGHLLTLKEIPIHIGKLNSEMVRSIWASLNLELLYFTNDDEERYSIQAQPIILRNLTVQAADPPLGYPLFTSSPITMYI